MKSEIGCWESQRDGGIFWRVDDKKVGSCPEGYEEVFKDSGIIYVGGMPLSDSIILNR